MKRLPAILFAGLSVIAVAGCDGHSSEPTAPIARPVLSVLIAPANQPQSGFAGVIEPRYQTDRAFQVLGRIIARPVEVGDTVRKGQVIAQSDPLAYQLALREGEADLVSAKSQLEKTVARKDRVRTLVERGVSPQAELDTAEEAAAAATAALRVASAKLAKAREDLSYTTLTADMDGIVTKIDAEVGQMAAPGMKVMTLARTDVREAVVDVPADIARTLVPDASFEVRLQSDVSVAAPGKIREVAPEADGATRLRRVKITLDHAVASFRIGATVTATPVDAVASLAAIELPASAVFERDGRTQVWVVDGVTMQVRSTAVDVAASNGKTLRIARGLEPGTRVVIAGVNSLSEGQVVRILEGAVA
ncbi:MAG: efflux RND transporter periplasmic adaptor subunit [Ferrovibrio sp.]|uniref:efflux RND transporter periplasmic adaptor subunit n=1 Tax=Ferrovibrio sp. TaxID=1917215 RepID=UPI00391A43AA